MHIYVLLLIDINCYNFVIGALKFRFIILVNYLKSKMIEEVDIYVNKQPPNLEKSPLPEK